MIEHLGTFPSIADIGPEIDVDFETHAITDDARAAGEHGVVSATSYPCPKPVCLAWTDGDGHCGLLPAWDGSAAAFLYETLRAGRAITNMSLAFDLAVAVGHLGDERSELFDLVARAYAEERASCLRIAQKAIDIARGEHKARLTRGKWVAERPGKSIHTLAVIVDHWLGEYVEKVDTWRMRYHELDGIPLSVWPRDAIEYPIKDAVLAQRARHKQREFVRARYANRDGYIDGRMPDEARQTRADFACALLSAQGVRTHGPAVAELRTKIEAEVGEALGTLEPLGLVTRKGPKFKREMSVIKERVRACYARRGLTAPETRTGEISTEKDVLLEAGDPETVQISEGLADAWGLPFHTVPVLELLGRASHSMTILSREIPLLESGTRYPICAYYDALKETGRTSTSRPNIQNPSRKGGVRECYVPRAGYLFADVDYEAIELHALAQACLVLVGRSALADALRGGLDPHLYFAALMLGIPYDEAKKRKRDPEVKSKRQLAKVANFGFPGGLGVASFVEYAHGYDERLKKTVDLRVAGELHEAWLRAWPEMRDYFTKISSALGPHEGEVVQLYSNRIRGGVEFTQACNTFFQGLTADGTKDAMWQLILECYRGMWTEGPLNEWEEMQQARGMPSPLLGSRPVIFLHDEFILEVPEDPHRAHAAAHRLAHVMRRAMQRWIPDIPIKADPALLRRWYKGAEGVTMDGGLLVPCMPVKIEGEERWVRDAA